MSLRQGCNAAGPARERRQRQRARRPPRQRRSGYASAALRSQPEEENDVGHHKPQPRRQCRQPAFHGDLHEIGVKVALLVGTARSRECSTPANGCGSFPSQRQTRDAAGSGAVHLPTSVFGSEFPGREHLSIPVRECDESRDVATMTSTSNPAAAQSRVRLSCEHQHRNEATSRQSCQGRAGLGSEHGHRQGEEDDAPV